MAPIHKQNGQRSEYRKEICKVRQQVALLLSQLLKVYQTPLFSSQHGAHMIASTTENKHDVSGMVETSKELALYSIVVDREFMHTHHNGSCNPVNDTVS